MTDERSAETEPPMADSLDRVSDLRRRHAEELDRLAARHERQIAAVKNSSRYQVGDALVGAVRQPKTLPRRVKQLWALFRGRSRSIAPALAPLPDVAEPASALRVGAVLDEFSWSCFASEAHLVELAPTSIDEQSSKALDLVLVESAWRGNRGQWQYMINGAGSLEPLRELVRTCADRNIPAVFWNKEDPVGFEAFIEAAKLFDVVLTTDSGSVPNYERDVPGAVVRALPFAAQPRTHNPIGRPVDPLRRVCFAGAWRGDKYPDRARQIDELMGPAHEMGVLDIFDRYANDPDRARLGFPAPYSDDVLGSLSYEETIDAYRRYSGFLNVNSVTDSPTMFSRRVFEILGCGTPVVSTPSAGIDELLGDVVITADSQDASRRAVEELISDRRATDRRGHLGYRLVHSKHTYQHRLATIAEAADVPFPVANDPVVAFTCVTNRPGLIERAVDAFTRQTYGAKQLIVVVNSDDVDRDQVAGIVESVPGAVLMFEPEDRTLGDCLNAAVQSTDAPYVAKIDDDDDYGADYLADMMLTFAYSDAPVAGKRSYYAYLEGEDRSVLRFAGNEFAHVAEVAGGTLVFERRLALDVPFQRLPRGTDTAFLRDVQSAGHRVFSADRFNFVQHRRADVADHTWRISAADFDKASETIGAGYAVDEFFV